VDRLPRLPTEDAELMVRAMQGLTADASALKALAGICAREHKLKRPYTHLVLSWAEGAEAPSQQHVLSAVAGARRVFASTRTTA